MKHKIKFLTIILFFILTGIVSAQSWDQIIKLAASDRQSNDKFGYSVSIDGDYAIVGSYFEDNDASGGGSHLNEAGSAYIFKNNAGTWMQVQKIVASDRLTQDRFGCSVSISGDYAIIGAYQDDEPLQFNNAGSAYIFKNNNGTWSQLQKITASDRGPEDHFGYSVSISNNYVIVGAPLEDPVYSNGVVPQNAGSAYV